jgi:GTP diphosphokinase / guanosine-3',5'-bis(diphosphate) 3'-diphosphatase
MIEKKVADDFLHAISSKYPYFTEYFPIIKKACDFAVKAHTGQKRKYSGEPYIIHPLSVALLCAKNFDDINLVIAGILHDCVEDNNDIHAETIYEIF